MKRKYLIYNPKTGSCLSRNFYFDTMYGKEMLYKDLEKLQTIMPEVEVGEVYFNDDKIISHTVPKDINLATRNAH